METPKPAIDKVMHQVLLETVVDSGETVETELRLLKRKLALSHNPVHTLHIIVHSEEEYQDLLDCVATYFNADHTIDARGTGLAQYHEIEHVLGRYPGLTIISDTITRTMVPFAGWLHSQDQGYKGTQQTTKLEQLAKQNDSRIILVRFFDATSQQELRYALAKNDFLDAQIKIHTPPQA